MKEEIMDMSFQELCDRVRIDYNNTLPESSYDSIENLVNALKAITKEDKPMYSCATGISYHGNVLKALFLDACYHYPYDKFTLREICNFGGLPLFKVQVMISKWNHRKYRYMTKLKKRTSNHENVYKLRKAAYVYYLIYKKRILLGFDLNLHRPQPKRVEIYASINWYGRQMGLTSDSLPEIALIKND
jgi:hypothetical protein